jgi:hypothetical protein
VLTLSVALLSYFNFSYPNFSDTNVEFRSGRRIGWPYILWAAKSWEEDAVEAHTLQKLLPVGVELRGLIVDDLTVVDLPSGKCRIVLSAHCDDTWNYVFDVALVGVACIGSAFLSEYLIRRRSRP